MCDILHVLPLFDLAPYWNILHSLDKASITTAELVSSQPIDIARRAQIPSADVAKLTTELLGALRQDTKPLQPSAWTCVSVLDDGLDEALGGGFPLGYLTEITGESGSGKTQFLLTLLLSVQLLGKSALYISTEAALSTHRLAQIIKNHPKLGSLAKETQPSLSNVHTIQAMDLEAQEHILRYQVPIAIERLNVGLVVVDSIASNYRAEFDDFPGTPQVSKSFNSNHSNGKAMGDRLRLLVQIGAFLRNLCRIQNIAIVVANQVSDRFLIEQTDPESLSLPLDPLTLDHQQRWFTGWGDLSYPGASGGSLPLKTPALGLIWTNQIATRIALIKESAVEERKRKRWLRVVFSAWACQTEDCGTEYEISYFGITSSKGGVFDANENDVIPSAPPKL